MGFRATLKFEVCYDAQAIGASRSHEISHMRRRYSALLIMDNNGNQ